MPVGEREVTSLIVVESREIIEPIDGRIGWGVARHIHGKIPEIVCVWPDLEKHPELGWARSMKAAIHFTEVVIIGSGKKPIVGTPDVKVHAHGPNTGTRCAADDDD